MLSIWKIKSIVISFVYNQKLSDTKTDIGHYLVPIENCVYSIPFSHNFEVKFEL